MMKPVPDNQDIMDSPLKITVDISVTQYAALQDKVKSRLGTIRPLMVGMSPTAAARRGFQEQYITLGTETSSYPARLVLHKSFTENATIILEDDLFGSEFTEGQDVSVCMDCQFLFAECVSFCVLTNTQPQGSQAFMQYLKEQLVACRVILLAGMTFVIQYLSQDIILKVLDVKFFGLQVGMPFKCIFQTQVHVESPKELNSKMNNVHYQVTFDSIGGYKTEIEQIQQQIDILFSNVSSCVQPVKGMLISGPVGSGKSLICEALRTTYGKKCISVSLDDVKSKYRGETEQNFKQCFDLAASRAPCLLVVDDVDDLCSGAVGGGRDGARMTTALLHLLDGLSSATSQGIMMVGTARKPESLDAALRRPGRLSYDVTLPHPDVSARQDILHKLLMGVAHTLEETDIADIANQTPGYEGGDLRSMVMEGVMQTTPESLTPQHLQSALAVVKPASLKETSTVTAQIRLSDIHGYETLKSQLYEAMDLALKEGHVFQQCGLSAPFRFLLFGPPGCGKSTLVKALATSFHLNVIPVKRSTILGKYFGESEQNLTRIFNQAKASAPCIIHFENFEGLGGKKKVDDDDGADVESRIINHLKVQLDGIISNEDIFVFAETNRPDLLNTDLIRPGRFHEYHLVDLPDASARQQLFHHHLTTCHFADNFSIDNLVTATNAFTVAEVIAVCEEVKEEVRRTDSLEHGGADSRVVNAQVIDQGIQAIIPATSDKLHQKYKMFSKTYCSG